MAYTQELLRRRSGGAAETGSNLLVTDTQELLHDQLLSLPRPGVLLLVSNSQAILQSGVTDAETLARRDACEGSSTLL